jgi:nitroreductase
MRVINDRKLEFETSEIFPKRWSPRAMSGEKLTDSQLMTLFEAAKWAPSSFNNQPWRFVYAKKGTKYFDIFLDFLMDANKVWCKNSSVLVVLTSKTTFDYNNKPDPTHSISTGAAWQNLALQGSMIDLVIHGMAGFDYQKAKSTLKIPDSYKVEMMIAIGKKGPISTLPEELRKIEKPSQRKELSEIAFEGEFKEK